CSLNSVPASIHQVISFDFFAADLVVVWRRASRLPSGERAKRFAVSTSLGRVTCQLVGVVADSSRIWILLLFLGRTARAGALTASASNVGWWVSIPLGAGSSLGAWPATSQNRSVHLSQVTNFLPSG